MSPLITHRIGIQVCLQRQRTYYHKCHRCVYRGKPVDYEPPSGTVRLQPLAPAAIQRNGAQAPLELDLEPPATVRSGGKTGSKPKRTGKSAKGAKAGKPES